MAIITLTTDFGYKDHFVGAIKGTILSNLSDVQIVDISHAISPFNIQECAYILKNAYRSFPEGTVHIVGVDSELSPENQHIAVQVDGHFFVTANNGVISLITSEINPEKIVEVDIPNIVSGSFPVMDVFVQVACHIARGGKLEVIGRPFNALRELREFEPRITNNGKSISGNVIYIDNYGNVVTNIQRNLFDAYRNGRDYEVNARTNKLRKIHDSYNGIINFDLGKGQRKGPGDALALFNSAGYMELAIYKSDLNSVGGASTLLGLNYRDTVTINFL
ncbi:MULTISPECIES: S-adenosyl-l-methionine hydroxide adenosyltransferase family protein [Flavobacteriaceae]|uniref:SAM hydrolase/SAM-dependent halogenase family protein n=1 Tax=Flavobacteriaceae TaxID=49546 RepID=UPI001490D4BD|nr:MULTISPECIES: SAM-dependent chlorinase/fluorinase [Allomuricauda]MDC6364440.1 SAM-dependent chlorinase/fluorinase [Muricauda sp. AC10]